MLASPSRTARSTRRWLAGILAFAAVVRVLYLLSYVSEDPLADHLLHDARRYHDWAVSVVSGSAGEGGAFYQAPLYPYLVALVYRIAGAEPNAIYGLQSAAGLLVILLVFRVARRAYGDRPGLAAAALASLYFPFVFHETKVLPATLSVLAAAVIVDRLQGAALGVRAPLWTVAGLAVGIGALASPGLLLLAPAAALWEGTTGSGTMRRRALRVAALLLGAAIPILPVTASNYAASGDLVLISTHGGITFYQGNHPGATGVFSPPEGFSGSIFRQRDEERALAEAEVGRDLSDGEVSSFWASKGLAFIADHPGAYAALLGRKLALALGNVEQPLEYNAHLDRNRFRALMPVPFALILGLAALRLLAERRWDRAETPIVLLIGTQAAMLLIFYVSGRYRLPAIPPLLAIAGCGATVLFGRLRRRSGVVPALAVVAAAAATTLLYLPVTGERLRSRQIAMGLCDIAGTELAGGRVGDAVSTYRRAVARDPSYPYAHLDLAKALRAAGETGEAEDAIRRAIRRAPGLGEAHFDLGVIAYESGRLEQAADAFADAFRLGPGDPRAANNLLGTLLRLGRIESARELRERMRRSGLPIDDPLERRLATSDAPPDAP